MNRAHRARAIIGSGFAAAALAAGAGPPAQAASATGWRVVSSQHYGTATAYSGLMTMVAPAKKDAWAHRGHPSRRAVERHGLADRDPAFRPDQLYRGGQRCEQQGHLGRERPR